MTETEVLIGFRIFRIDAESGTCLRYCVRAVVEAIEEIRQRTMILGEIGHQTESSFQLIVSVVPKLLLAKHLAKSKMQGRIFSLRTCQCTKLDFGLMKVLLLRLRGSLQQRGRNSRTDLCGLHVA